MSVTVVLGSQFGKLQCFAKVNCRTSTSVGESKSEEKFPPNEKISASMVRTYDLIFTDQLTQMRRLALQSTWQTDTK